MRKGWTEIELGEVLNLEIDAVPVDPSETYQFAGVYSFGRGLFVRDTLRGSDTTYSHFHRLHEGQLVMSQPKGWEGAITVVSEEFDGRFLSSVFPTFRAQTSRLSPDFLHVITKCKWLWDALLAKSSGIGARRNSVYPEHLLAVRVPLPPPIEQQRIVSHLKAIEARLFRTKELREEATKEAEAFTTSLHLAVAKGRVVSLGQLLQLDEKQVAVTADGSYPQVGIRSFGLGLFMKPPVLGANTTYRAFNVLRSGQFVMSQVKGWEGALGVAGKDYDGWFASPEYRTFSCINDECDSGYLAHIVATPWFRKQLLAATQGIGARRERVRPEMLLGLEMPFPIISRQIEAARLLEKQVAAKRLSLQSSEREASLLPSLLDRIFNA